MTHHPETPGGPLAFHALAQDLKELGREGFIQEHGDCFLMLHAADLGSRAPGETIVPDGRVNTAATTFHVFPVRKSDRNEDQGITVGRTDDNDIVVFDDTISRRHAALEQREDGAWRLFDLGSRNGTSISDEAVAGRANGGVPLVARTTVLFGSVSMKFMPFDDFALFAEAFIGPVK